ncbi:SKN1-domain-containing protein [Linderina pennispora]|uniref:SKN1-domain-containing protein n=1 Tax=Linderina pennispora TaxID=61395 RepID=A0A1Y1WLX6_9FUNG|nr:SKN1-domain-containing protein [Linderina pennispora]ORX74186.1 SKN1-domain-containing protein [Linderina pennispora]
MSIGKRYHLWKAKLLWSGHGWCNVMTLGLIMVALLFMFIGLPILGHYNWGRKHKSAGPGDSDIRLRPERERIRKEVLIGWSSRWFLRNCPSTLIRILTWNGKSADGKMWKLVFSDEFNEEGRKFGPNEDPTWEAVDPLWYDPYHATTEKGKLVITLEKKMTHEGLPLHLRCFQGGYLEAKVSMPADGTKSGYWPAIWTLGNLGRAGYGATTDGMWPYTYDTCDEGVMLNQTNSALSMLPGQRLNACVCSAWNGTDKDTIGRSRYNSYFGGTFQQSVSSLHYVDPAASNGIKYSTYGFEYRPGKHGYIRWYVDGRARLSKVSQRIIAEEPMYIIMNLGISSGFAYIADDLKFPAKMHVDYIRLFQDPDDIRLSCDPPDMPTGKYIQNHPRAYYNANLTRWKQTGNKCSNKHSSPFDKYSYVDFPSN